MTLGVLHLAGSSVSDFYCDLSRLYAADCLEAVENPARYEPTVAYVTPDGLWRFPESLDTSTIEQSEAVPLADAVARISASGVDVMVPQMFCMPGMTAYRALFDLLEIPYIGNTPEVMALGGHKARAKAVVAGSGVSVPQGEVVRRGDHSSLEPPVIIKPADADNSLGVALVRDRSGYTDALAEAFRHSEEVIIEEYIEAGREVRCGIIERDDELVCLPLEEYRIHRTEKPIRNYEDKLSRNESGEMILMAKEETRAWIVAPEDPVNAIVYEAAKRCYTAMGCRHYGLFDFRVDPEGNPWFLEAGLYCSFARKSVVSMMAQAAGIPLEDLFALSIENALDTRRRASL